MDDFPDFLDKNSKAFLLQLYDEEPKSDNHEKNNQRGKTVELKKRSTSEISLIAKSNHLKDIYQGTHHYLLELVKNNAWKGDIKLPKIKKTENHPKTIANEFDWKENERKRINNVYS